MKYMGSKNRISKHILPHIQESIDKTGKYLEPFVGGANLIDKVVCDVRVGMDFNEYLIDMWKALEGGWKPPETLTREEYVNIRAKHKDYPKHLVGWVAINGSYSGKWWGGYAGETQTKKGFRDYYKEALNNVRKQVPSIVGVKFEQGNFFDLDVSGYTIYCDPPYRGTTGYKDDFNHDLFYEKVLELSENNDLLISEYWMPDQFEEVWGMAVKSSLSANGKSGG